MLSGNRRPTRALPSCKNDCGDGGSRSDLSQQGDRTRLSRKRANHKHKLRQETTTHLGGWDVAVKFFVRMLSPIKIRSCERSELRRKSDIFACEVKPGVDEDHTLKISST